MQVSTLILGTSCSTMPELFTPTSDSVCRYLVEHIQVAVSYGDAAGLLRLWKECGTEKRSGDSGDVTDRSSIADIVRASQRYPIAAD
jgi:hypothetical protein